MLAADDLVLPGKPDFAFQRDRSQPRIREHFVEAQLVARVHDVVREIGLGQGQVDALGDGAAHGFVDARRDQLDTALVRASRAYEGFLKPPKPGETFEERAREHAKMFVGRGEPGASEIMQHLFDADYLLKNDLVFIGSPQTVAAKLRAAAEAGVFNVFLGEFNFADLPEDALMRSIRLFGEQVIPALRGYEPF